MPFTSAKEIFGDRMPKHLKDNPDIAEKVNAKYKFILEGDDGGTWLVDLTKPEGGEVSQDDADADCIVTMQASDFVAMSNGELDGAMAFMSGKLQVSGDMGLAMKLQEILG